MGGENSSLPGCNVCSVGWLLLNGKCYYFSENMKSWTESDRLCKSAQADLATVKPSQIILTVAETAGSNEQRVLQKEIKALMQRQQVELSGGEICSVRVSDFFPIVIPSICEMLIWCRASIGLRGKDYQALVEPVFSDSRPTVLPARGVVDVRKGRVPVRLLNCGEEEATIPQYATVAKLLTVSNNAIQASEPLVSSDQVEDNGSVKQLEEWCQQLQVGTDSTPSYQKSGVYRVTQEYERVFSKHPLDFGKAKGVQNHIPTGDHPPIKERYRPKPPYNINVPKVCCGK
ncbi:uncharacterized protein [Dendrobates tinctorius]|uniref:uncharacterized protein isoform X2 n=1 Tax=Dendrobates tinctorius TaxID=92724 RepID=UPI003CC93A18